MNWSGALEWAEVDLVEELDQDLLDPVGLDQDQELGQDPDYPGELNLNHEVSLLPESAR